MHWTYDAIAEIKTKRILHRNYERALSESFAALLAASPGEIVCIAGPSRVGKSRLAGELARLIVGDRPQVNDRLVPVVSVLASNCTNRGVFRTKDFAVHCLEAIRHPIYGVPRSDDPWDALRTRLIHSTPESSLIDAFRKAIEICQTKYLFFDEGQHVGYALGGDHEAAAILNSWKSFAAMTKTVLVLIGAYPLIDLLQLSPHMLGRKHQVHFPRYAMTEDDLLIFDQILDTYSSLVALPPDVRTLRAWNDLLYPDSFGCIGLLEGWLRDGLARAQAGNSDFLLKEHLIETRRPRGDLEAIATEISAGEHALMAWDPANDQPSSSSKQTAPIRRGKKPFQKNPRRYQIGCRI